MKRAAILGRLTGSLVGSLHARGLMLWAAALATGILVVSQHVGSVRLATEIAELRTARERIEAEIGFLEMECVELTGRQRVETYAVERLGMRYPRAGEVCSVHENGRRAREKRPGDYVLGGSSGPTDG